MTPRVQFQAGNPGGGVALIYALSIAIAILVAAGSIGGILYRGVMYPTDALRESFVPTDMVTLLIGPPIPLGTIWSARRGTLLGLLLWPGALLFVLYIFLLLQPFLTAAPFVLVDVVVVSFLGLICFVPLARFVRGVMAGGG